MIKIKINVSPNSSHFKIELTGTYPKVYLRNPPEKGKANIELIKQLSKRLNAKVTLLAGHNSKTKLLGIDLTQEEFDRRLSEICSSN